MSQTNSLKFGRVVLTTVIMLSLAACGKPALEDETANLPATSLLALGRGALDENRYQDAIDIYKTLESRYPYGTPAEQAQLDLAYTYHKYGEPELAVAAADRFIRLHPTHERVDYAYYLKGLSIYREKSGVFGRITGTNDLSNRDPRPAREAYNTFREVVVRFPDSPYTEDSRKRMLHMVNVLARHDIEVARHYLARGAYVAVVNRTKKVIEEFQQAPAVEDALGLMGIAYREMGMSQLQQDTRRILETNFPSSAYLKQL